MDDRPALNDAEWGLILDLLRSEQQNLPHEIHYTTRDDVRQDLRRRLKMVDFLIERLQAVHA
jgi:hypothetical protein